MPRIRTIKPEFFTSPDTAQLDFPARIFYEALWCWADDFGVGETNLNGLLGFAFPDTDNFTAQDVRRFCADVARIMRVTFYTVRGRHYYAIPTWDEHQKTERRTTRRKYPTPDDPDATPDQRIYACADSAPDMPRKNGAESALEQGNRGTGEQGKEILVAQVSAAPTPVEDAPAGATKQGRYIEPDWQPSESTVVWAKTNYSHLDLPAEHQRFVNYWLGESGQKARKRNWDRAFMNWLSNSRGNRNSPTRVGLAPSDARVARVQALKNNNYEETKELLA